MLVICIKFWNKSAPVIFFRFWGCKINLMFYDKC